MYKKVYIFDNPKVKISVGWVDFFCVKYNKKIFGWGIRTENINIVLELLLKNNMYITIAYFSSNRYLRGTPTNGSITPRIKALLFVDLKKIRKIRDLLKKNEEELLNMINKKQYYLYTL